MELEENPDRLPDGLYAEVRDWGLIGGACGYCASVFDVERAIEKVGIALDGNSAEHGPDIGQLADQGYQINTVGYALVERGESQIRRSTAQPPPDPVALTPARGAHSRQR